MIDGSTIVLDVGKTHSKLSLWNGNGVLVDRWTRANESRRGTAYRALDVEGIDRWLFETLADCARQGRVGQIVPVGHGAAAAILCDGALSAEPMDYEKQVPEAERAAYAAQRDAFEDTGSPFLPGALNLGMQLHWIESLRGPLAADAMILPWPQYWAWRLSGVAASEVTSLGCHSDLWRPNEARYSDLAVARGWDARMAPMRRAGETLATVAPAVAKETSLPPDCAVLCGLHDSNAALLGSRGHPEIAGRDATVVSTGTWFVAMRTPAPSAGQRAISLPKNRDCLLNVDVEAQPVPSARFMGGREVERIRGNDRSSGSNAELARARMARAKQLIAQNACAVPSFAPGVGPFPDSTGRLLNLGDDSLDRHVAGSLYLALMTDTLLTLIGSAGNVLIEGRFADDELFVRALATIRPDLAVFTCEGENDLAYGVLRLVEPALAPPSALIRVQPLTIDFAGYVETWRRLVEDDGIANERTTRISH